MLILGLSGSPNLIQETNFGIVEGNFHDAAAALIDNGKVVAAFEEERLNRIKHTNKFPFLAAKACLDSYGVSIEKVDHFAFSQSEKSLDWMLADIGKAPGNSTGAARSFLRDLLETGLEIPIDERKFEFFDHHYAHSATAFYPSQFEESMVLTIDGSGGEYAGCVYDGINNTLKKIQSYSNEQSLGHFYNKVTQLLGFGYFDEYKIMGLAPYGNPKIYQKLFDKFYTLLPEGQYVLHTHEVERLKTIFPSGAKTSIPTQQQMNIAASLQETLEKIVFYIVKFFKLKTGHSRLCMAGGVALNCTLNGKLINSGLFKDVFVFPAANDSGLPIGSALATYFKYTQRPIRYALDTLYLGTEVGNNDDISDELSKWKGIVEFDKSTNIELQTAELLADNKVIGWVQGQAEFAPRALGNRSILADSRPEENKERINAMIKKREGFRPFAPSVLEEYADQYFELPNASMKFPFMMFVLNVKEKYRKKLGAITHVDGTARLQTVSKQSNSRYWQVIDYFRNITGTPVILNTSFNNNVEPIADSAADAITSFLTTQLDYLVIGDFLVKKNPFSYEKLTKLFISLPLYIKLKRTETFTLVKDLNPEIDYCIEYSFNSKMKYVSKSIFEMLTKANGKRTVGQIISEEGIDDHENISPLMEELFNLWCKRMIILLPEEDEKKTLLFSSSSKRLPIE